MNQPKLFMALFAEMAFDDAEVNQAVSDALRLFSSDQWIRQLTKLPFSNKPEYLKVLLPVFDAIKINTGIKAIGIADVFLPECVNLITVCGNADVSSAPDILKTLLTHLESDDLKTRDEAAIALLKQGQLAPLKKKLGTLRPDQITYEAMAVATDISLFQFIDKLPVERLNVGSIKALGLIGLPDVVPKLVHLLSDKEKAPAIAEATFAITGAPLYDCL